MIVKQGKEERRNFGKGQYLPRQTGHTTGEGVQGQHKRGERERKRGRERGEGLVFSTNACTNSREMGVSERKRDRERRKVGQKADDKLGLISESESRDC